MHIAVEQLGAIGSHGGGERMLPEEGEASPFAQPARSSEVGGSAVTVPGFAFQELKTVVGKSGKGVLAQCNCKFGAACPGRMVMGIVGTIVKTTNKVSAEYEADLLRDDLQGCLVGEHQHVDVTLIASAEKELVCSRCVGRAADLLHVGMSIVAVEGEKIVGYSWGAVVDAEGVLCAAGGPEIRIANG